MAISSICRGGGRGHDEFTAKASTVFQDRPAVALHEGRIVCGGSNPLADLVVE